MCVWKMGPMMIFILIAFIMTGCDGEQGTRNVNPESSKKPAHIDVAKMSLKERLDAACAKGGSWLISQQQEDGSWHSHGRPSMAITSMCVYALTGISETHESYEPVINKGLAFLLKNMDADGTISDFGMYRTYATSLFLMALSAVDEKKYNEQVTKMQKFLVEKQVKDGINEGGSGYGDMKYDETAKKPVVRHYADMSNSAFAAEALKASGLSDDSEYWKHMVEFVSKSQNSSETNTSAALIQILKEQNIVNGNDGGVRYSPTETRAGTTDNGDGTQTLNSYGAMTYAGLKAYLYANLGKEDERVKAAMKWIVANYSVDGHPGFAFDAAKRTQLSGLYYYYMMMSRALDAYGEHVIVTEDGRRHRWAEEIGHKLLELQKHSENRAWKNDVPRWEEGDPFIATSYVLIAYRSLRKNL